MLALLAEHRKYKVFEEGFFYLKTRFLTWPCEIEVKKHTQNF
jgi:hypothetical protein